MVGLCPRVLWLLCLVFFQLFLMGSFRSQPDLQKFTVSKTGLGLTFAVSHMCGWRIYMEDAHINESPLKNSKNSLFGVFDGHGGAEVSTFIERHFIKELESNKNYQGARYEQALRETFMRMDVILASEEGRKEIVSIQTQMRNKDNGPKYQEDSHAGCTANVVLITPDYIYCANAGDSRAIACLNGGQLFELSRDHKPTDPIEYQRITKAGSNVSEGRVNGGLNLSRAMGDLQYKRANVTPELQAITANPDITKLKNEGIQFIIMGCDGIWQVKSNSQMVEWIRKRLAKQITIQAIIEELLDELISRDSGNLYGMDNMSAILIKFNKK